MRPPRILALFALFALMGLRVASLAAATWTAAAVECCCGRHSVDHDCGCASCPSHQHHPDDGRAHLRACTHHVDLADTAPAPAAVLAPAPIDLPAPRFAAAPDAPRPSLASRTVHPESPPS